VTLNLVDVSRYQVEVDNPLDLVKAKTAGYQIINVALTGGKGYVSGAWARTYLEQAATLGYGRMVYHWLDGRSTGAAQAAAQIKRMKDLFGSALTGFAHQVDVEETGKDGIPPPTWAHVREYVDAVQQALGRHMVIYSGDWWWKPKAWPGATVTPYLMAQPNTGKLTAYPGDTAAQWTAGYGGWDTLAIMQWGVHALPGTVGCSLAALRDHGVWADLTGGDALMPQADPGNAQPDAWIGPAAPSALVAELADVGRDLMRQAAEADEPRHLDDAGDLARWAATIGGDVERDPLRLDLMPMGAGEVCSSTIVAEMDDWIAAGGTNLGCVGDKDHGTGFHRGANYIPATDYSRRRDPNGADGPFINWNASCAGDFRHGGKAALREAGRKLLAVLMAGGYPMICEFIGQPWPDRPVMYWARWEGVSNLREYTGSGHDVWYHISWYRSRSDQRPYMWRNSMALEATDKTWLTSAAFTNAVAAATVEALLTRKIDPTNDLNPNRTFHTFILDVQNMRDAWRHALTDPKVKGRPLPGSGFDKLMKSADTLAAGLAALRTENSAAEAATAALVRELIQLVQAGGGDVDSAAILSKLDTVQAEVRAAATEAGDRAREDVLDALRRGAEAEAAALRSTE
jgi:hypothetical protein